MEDQIKQNHCVDLSHIIAVWQSADDSTSWESFLNNVMWLKNKLNISLKLILDQKLSSQSW